MAGKKYLFPLLFLYLAQVESATLMESSYEYVINFGKSIAPSLLSLWECFGEEQAWSCAREKAGKILDGWGEKVESERRSWQEAADSEVSSSGRAFEELPSKLGEEVEGSLNNLVEIFHHGVVRALQSRKHDSGGGIDSITISAGGEKTKKKKKKQKPPKIHLVHPVMMHHKPKEQKGRNFPNGRQSWVIGNMESFGLEDARVTRPEDGKERVEEVKREKRDVGSRDVGSMDVGSRDVGSWNVGSRSVRSRDVGSRDVGSRGVGSRDEGSVNVGSRDVVRGEPRGVLADLWGMGTDALDVLAESALEAEYKENGVQDKSSFEEQRGKKKKKKKAILKLLILGAVLKAKIGTLLQILSFKLQVKFFIVAVLGLAINLARLWIDLKNKHNHQPQKVIYYEHAQHQHHYDHEDEHESHGWGPWSRSMEPEETDVELDVDLQNSPYRGQVRNTPYTRPVA